MEMDDKLLVGQEDYWKGYRESAANMKQDPNIIQFDKLCYHVFGMSDDGKALLNYFKEHMLFPSIPGSNTPHFDKMCMYYEGYREAFRQLIHASANYVLRKEAEAKASMNKEGA